eukprot:4859122-Amphidinium_carterae.1
MIGVSIRRTKTDEDASPKHVKLSAQMLRALVLLHYDSKMSNRIKESSFWQQSAKKIVTNAATTGAVVCA